MSAIASRDTPLICLLNAAEKWLRLEDPERARRLGEAARERVREHFLGVRHLLQYAELFERLDV